jgi:hypothetical protein
MKRNFLIIVLLLACPSAQAADAYKWTDAAGVVHYTQSEPPADVKAMKVHLAGTPSAAASDLVAADDETGLPTAQNPQQRDTQVIAAAGVQARCERARADLELLQGNAPVGLNTGDASNAQPLDEAGRKAQIANAQSTIAHSCL